ncbi:MAG: hypothetical protein V3S00_06710, partial [Dehalococcoidia bacterium]
MIKGLRLSSIWSEDLNNLLPFYRDVLGLEVGMEAPSFVVLGDRGYIAKTSSASRGPAAGPCARQAGSL